MTLADILAAKDRYLAELHRRLNVDLWKDAFRGIYVTEDEMSRPEPEHAWRGLATWLDEQED